MAKAYRAARIEAKFRERLVASGKVFVTTSRDFIRSKMDTEKEHRYFKEILHSIFFHCHIYRDPELNRQSIDPKEILDETLQSELAVIYPDVFESYTSQLPRRSPFSILLEVVETMVDPKVVETEKRKETILRELARLNDDMIIHISGGNHSANDFCFAATVVSCSSFKRSDLVTQEYFGASMSCKGRIPTMIFISVACIETWNDNVAQGVCLAAKGEPSIKLPDTVWSIAHRLCSPQETGNNSHTYKAWPPCLWCQNTFPNVTFSPPATAQNEPKWQCGNCAECEAISNLLNGETRVSDETQQLNKKLPSLMTLREERERQLSEHLEKCDFNVNSEARFYNPVLHCKLPNL